MNLTITMQPKPEIIPICYSVHILQSSPITKNSTLGHVTRAKAPRLFRKWFWNFKPSFFRVDNLWIHAVQMLDDEKTFFTIGSKPRNSEMKYKVIRGADSSELAPFLRSAV